MFAFGQKPAVWILQMLHQLIGLFSAHLKLQNDGPSKHLAIRWLFTNSFGDIAFDGFNPLLPFVCRLHRGISKVKAYLVSRLQVIQINLDPSFCAGTISFCHPCLQPLHGQIQCLRCKFQHEVHRCRKKLRPQSSENDFIWQSRMTNKERCLHSWGSLLRLDCHCSNLDPRIRDGERPNVSLTSQEGITTIQCVKNLHVLWKLCSIVAAHQKADLLGL
mmetsp:Transcript_67492/g.147932  ORF Transcript_67492/g.147932 Transcript_67492/m.147932 type:complete len:218 (-) Transcript_67492:1463-2116(-)